jgi:hypothetical protein
VSWGKCGLLVVARPSKETSSPAASTVPNCTTKGEGAGAWPEAVVAPLEPPGLPCLWLRRRGCGRCSRRRASAASM